MIDVLCCSEKSNYKLFPQYFNVYDKKRNALNYNGNNKLICHPPCRMWSNRLNIFSKKEKIDFDLAYLCYENWLKNGGVIEQPAYSKFFKFFDLPLPCKGKDFIRSSNNTDIFSILIFQSWFNFPTPKRTWLCFNKINKNFTIPFKLSGFDLDISNLSKTKRSETTVDLALWFKKIL